MRYGKKKAYELELLLAKIVQQELERSGLSLKEFGKENQISLGELKHGILPNLDGFSCGHELRVVAEIFNKLGYDLKFVVLSKEE